MEQSYKTGAKKFFSIVKTILTILVATYVAMSIIVSGAYNMFPEQAWNIACNRNGLLVLSAEPDSVAILHPFCNDGDVYLVGLNWANGDWRVFSDSPSESEAACVQKTTTDLQTIAFCAGGQALRKPE